MHRFDPEKSTDFLYSKPHDPAWLQEIADAQGIEDKMVTGLTIKPERFFYGACLSIIQHHYTIPTYHEDERGKGLKHLADLLYQRCSQKFITAFQSKKAELEETHDKIDGYVRAIDQLTDERFGQNAFEHIGRSPESWRRNADNVYSNIRQRIKEGLYTLPEGQNITSLTSFMVKRLWDYKVMRKTARDIFNHEFENTRLYHRRPDGDFHTQACNSATRFLAGVRREIKASAKPEELKELSPRAPVVTLLTHIDPKDRITEVFLGGPGLGKNTAMRIACKKQGWKEGRKKGQKEVDGSSGAGLLALDPDYLKLALYEKAKEEGVLTGEYHSSQVHSESSFLVLELWNQLCYWAEENGIIPNVLTCTDFLNPLRLKGIFAGSSRVKLNFFSGDPLVAKASADKRGRTMDLRYIEKSCTRATRNLLTLVEHPNRELYCYLYERDKVEEAPKFVGTIDMHTNEVVVSNLEMFLKIAGRSGLAQDVRECQKLFLQKLLDSGLTIYVMKKGTTKDTEFRLNKKQGLECAIGTGSNSENVKYIHSLVGGDLRLGNFLIPNSGEHYGRGRIY